MTDFEKTIHEITALINQRDERIRELESQLTAMKTKTESTAVPTPQWRDIKPEDFSPGVKGWVRNASICSWQEKEIVGCIDGDYPWVTRCGGSYRYAQIPADYQRPMTVDELTERLRKFMFHNLCVLPSGDVRLSINCGTVNRVHHYGPTIIQALKAAEAGKGGE